MASSNSANQINNRDTEGRFQRGSSKLLANQPEKVPYHRGDKAKRITGPYSRAIDGSALGTINGSTRAGRFLRAYEGQLIQHVGGSPTVTQRALISRTARLALHLELLDKKALKDSGGLTPTDCHFYCVWANSLARHLAKLGFEPAKPKPTASLSLKSVLSELGHDAAP
jgi:hypothetical protein